MTKIGGACLVTIFVWCIIELAVQFGHYGHSCGSGEGVFLYAFKVSFRSNHTSTYREKIKLGIGNWGNFLLQNVLYQLHFKT